MMKLKGRASGSQNRKWAATALGLGLFLGSSAVLNAEEASDPQFQAEMMDRVSQMSLSDSEKVAQLGRISVLMGGFAELDLGVLEMKVQPYVELRFNRISR